MDDRCKNSLHLIKNPIKKIMTFPLITDPTLEAYCKKYSKALPESILALAPDADATGQSIMVSGPYLGMFLKMMSMLIAPSYILELGTFTGYGTRCLLEGLREDGLIYTLEKSDEYDSYSNNAFSSSPRRDEIQQLKGDASELIATIDEQWDLVFIDAAKRQYSHYFDEILPRLRKGGVMLADNVLWKGKVGHPDNDKLGQGLDAFNQKVFADNRVMNIILPIDDGVNFIIKK